MERLTALGKLPVYIGQIACTAVELAAAVEEHPLEAFGASQAVAV